MPSVFKNTEDNELMVLDKGFVASYKDSKWVPKALFDADELSRRFYPVTDKNEAEKILAEARIKAGGKKLATA